MIIMNSKNKNPIPIDNYSLKNVALAATISGLLNNTLMIPLEICKTLQMKDMEICSRAHFENKGLLQTLLKKNPGKQSSCGECFKYKFSGYVLHKLVRKQGLTAPFSGYWMFQVLGVFKGMSFLIPFEFCKK